MRENLAKGLGKTMLDAAEEDKPEKQDRLQAELAQLATAYRAEEWVGMFRNWGLL